MRAINFSADELSAALLNLEPAHGLCMLDSCAVSYLGSHLLIAGINPIETLEITEDSPEKTFAVIDEKLARSDSAAIMTISYEFGLKLHNLKPRPKEIASFTEPDFFVAFFDVLIVHDYATETSFLVGKTEKFAGVEAILANSGKRSEKLPARCTNISSNFSRVEYLKKVATIQEFIKSGETYQTNLTRRICAEIPPDLTAENIFATLRKDYPAPFAAFIRRKNDVVISASPERFFEVQFREPCVGSKLAKSSVKLITVSPIKGTRPRGKSAAQDLLLEKELLASEKDRAENIMIVDLLRNDIGRICEFGSVNVEKICELEKHPTFYHLVSTVSGRLREKIGFTDILRAVFPCGSITGAPKIRTMQIIDALENVGRGLSMGAIGYLNPTENPDFLRLRGNCLMDFSVAIRTLTIRGNQAIFNVGGGITIDSIAEEEEAETLVKAGALLAALNAEDIFF